MSYPTVSAPYGFLPVNRIDGMPYAGAIRQIPISSTETNAVCFGDLVEISGGTGGVILSTDGAAATPCGVCVGGQYTNSSGQTVQGQFIPGTGVTNRVAYVVDDPTVAFKAAVLSSGTTVTTTGVTRAVVGSNMSAILNTPGNTTTGNSEAGIAYSATGVVTATVPLRVIDVVPATKLASGNYVELIVKLNTHQYNSTTGVVAA